MDYKVLYRKYRPSDFDNVCGQDYSIKILKNSINSGKISHAYLFTGPRGTGKTSTAKIFAKAINCLSPIDGNPCGKCNNCLNTAENPDIIEIDAASNNGVDEIREIINNVKIAPSFSKYKVYIIDEVHMLSTSAFNALLLTLEEPPGHVVFILATTDVQNVPITILSRCQRFDFKPIDRDVIAERIKFVVNNENIEITDEAISEISYVSNGGLRDALSILDQLCSSNNKIDIDDVYSNFGTVSSVKIDELLDYFKKNDVESISKIIKEFSINGINYAVLIEKIIEKLKNIAIDIKIGRDNSTDFDNIYNLIVDLNNCLNVSNININPYILIELTILKYINNKTNEKDENSVVLTNDNDEISEKIIISQEIIEKNITREIKKDEKIDTDEISNEDKFDFDENFDSNFVIDDKMLRMRINNCFVDANKEYKSSISNKWKDFIEFAIDDDKLLYSLLIDTDIAVASSKYAVLIASNLSTSKLINKKIVDIENKFNSYFSLNYRFVCLSNEEWENEIVLFKNNKKNGIIYKYIEEPSDLSKKDKDDIDNLVSEIFNDELIEYE